MMPPDGQGPGDQDVLVADDRADAGGGLGRNDAHCADVAGPGAGPRLVPGAHPVPVGGVPRGPEVLEGCRRRLDACRTGLVRAVRAVLDLVAVDDARGGRRPG